MLSYSKNYIEKILADNNYRDTVVRVWFPIITWKSFTMKWLFLKIYSNGSNKDFMGWLGILNILLFPWKICQKRVTVFHSFKSCIGGCSYEMSWLN